MFHGVSEYLLQSLFCLLWRKTCFGGMCVFIYCSNGGSYIFLQRRHMFIFMQTFGNRTRFAKTKKPFAKKKCKFIFKKIGDRIGDGSGATLRVTTKQRQSCPSSPRVVFGILRTRAGNWPKSAENLAKKYRKSCKKCLSVVPF